MPFWKVHSFDVNASAQSASSPTSNSAAKNTENYLVIMSFISFLPAVLVRCYFSDTLVLRTLDFTQNSFLDFSTF